MYLAKCKVSTNKIVFEDYAQTRGLDVVRKIPAWRKQSRCDSLENMHEQTVPKIFLRYKMSQSNAA